MSGANPGAARRQVSYWWAVALAAAAPILGVAATAAAQYVGIDDLGGDLGFRLTYDKQDVSSSSQPSSDNRHLFFGEDVGLHTKGFAYDRALSDFNYAVVLGFSQDTFNFESSGASNDRNGHGHVLGYDLWQSLLPRSAYPLELFGNRSESNSERDFAGTTEIDLDGFGAILRTHELPLDSTFTLEQRSVEQTNTLATPSTQQDETRRIASYRGEQRAGESMLLADYRFEDVSDSTRPGADFHLNTAGLTDVLRFGEYLDHTLASSVRAYRRDGQVASTQIQGHESIALRHSRSLNSSLGYTFGYFDQSGVQNITNSLLAALQHRYYEGLDSSINLNFLRSELSPGWSMTYGGGLGTSYRKRIPPIGGDLFAGVRSGYDLSEQHLPGGQGTVSDEPHEFADGLGAPLDNADVVESSIVVTDEAKSTVYAEGIDYFVEVVGRRTFLRRNVFGEIEAGQTVLVSYSFQTSPNLRIGSRPLALNGGFEFEWVKLYYDGQRLREDVFEGDPNQALGTLDTDTAGIDLHFPGPRFNVNLVNQWHRYEAVDISYKGFSFNQNVVASPHRLVDLYLNSAEQLFDFDQPQRTNRSYYGRASVIARPVGGLTLESFFGLRHLSQTDVPTDDLKEFGSSARYFIGLFVLSVSYYHGWLDIGSTNQRGELIRFQLRRLF
jgi:hypothetical protein